MHPNRNLKTVPAALALADGAVFHGQSFGAPVTVTGEIVFNTGMTGYQEILTDPSYCGQIVTMTCPHIGNVGVNPEDVEANRPWAAGLIVREVSRRVSNWRAGQSLPDYLHHHNLPGLTEVDTRALVRHIRARGAMMGALSAGDSLSPDDLVDLARSAPPMDGLDLVKDVTCPEPYRWEQGVIPAWQRGEDRKSDRQHQKSYRVVAYDFGIKHNILRLLTDAGCRVTVVPATTPAEAVLDMKPDGVFLSNGPGDPAAVTYAIRETRLAPRRQRADIRHLFGPPNFGAGARRVDPQAQIRPSRQQPAGKGNSLGFGGRAPRGGDDYQPQSRVCRVARLFARRGRGDPSQPERRLHRGAAPQNQTCLQHPIPPGGVARPARCVGIFWTVCRDDGKTPGQPPMKKPNAKSSSLTCPFCGEENVVQYLPKETGRQLFHEDITVPAEPEPQVLTVAVMRITYERDYFCPSCGHQWSQTYTTESQKHV